MSDEKLPELDLRVAPGASIRTMTCNHLVLETYEEVMAKREDAGGALDLLEFTMYRDFSANPEDPERELYRCSVVAGAIMEVHEITPRIWEKGEKAAKDQYEQMQEEPPGPFGGLGGVHIIGL
jgi:hypothetical protein